MTDPDGTGHNDPHNPDPKPFLVEVAVNAPTDDVWAALTTPATIGEWFGWDYEGIDAEIRQIFVDEAKLDAPHRVSWGDGSYLEVTADGPRSIVRAVLPGNLDDSRWDDVYDGVEEGWRAFLTQLRFLLERRPTGRRRTVFLTGDATGAQVIAVAGDGEVLLTGVRSLALLDPHGHLVVADIRLKLDDIAPSRASITVSTYGLDDKTFAEVRDRWAARWLPVAAEAEVTVGKAPLPPGIFDA
jgi:uncharacterized protein YndB with AHSA1/START domain